MARGKGPSEEQKRELAITACRRMISRGERPRFRIHLHEDMAGGYVVVDSTFRTETWVKSRSDAIAGARFAIAALLEVGPMDFDVEVEEGSWEQSGPDWPPADDRA